MAINDMRFPTLDWHINSQYSEADCRLHLGRIPLLISPESDDPVWLQVQENYPGGWNPVLGEERLKWTFTRDGFLIYPGLPPVTPAAFAQHRDEQIFVYPAGWLVVAQGDDFTVARIEP